MVSVPGESATDVGKGGREVCTADPSRTASVDSEGTSTEGVLREGCASSEERLSSRLDTAVNWGSTGSVGVGRVPEVSEAREETPPSI